MKATENVSETVKAKPRNSALFLGIAILVIILILVGPPLYSKWQGERVQADNRYAGFDFWPSKLGKAELWTTQIVSKEKIYDVPFYFHPRETENVVIEPGTASRFLFEGTQPELVYITFPLEGGSKPVIAGVEISRLTGYQYDLLNIKTNSGLHVPPPDNNSVYPVITCDDATRKTAVLYFEEGENNIIFSDPENLFCIHIQYTDVNESLRVADRFAFALLQIMPD